MQTIYFYIDDSGVFCEKNNDFFILGGLCFVSSSEKEVFLRSYSKIEKRTKRKLSMVEELKGSNSSNQTKDNILRSMNRYRKFASVIYIPSIHPHILSSKYSSQRYKDYALKLGIKHKVGKLIGEKIIDVDKDIRFIIKIDRHNIATDGIYGLKESIYEEFKNGVSNFKYNMVHPPLFKSEVKVDLEFCDSATTRGIRAADFVSNKLFYEYNTNNLNFVNKCHIKRLP